MNVAEYARVSSEGQDSGDKTSVQQQTAEMNALCERNGWRVVGVFVDKENYRATQSPKKGKIVNPSGERADRPQFLAMLDMVKAGNVDIVLCWRDDRLVRHPRVAVALEDALDIGDVHRNGKPKIEVRDATGAAIDRFTLGIKAAIWREENKRRAERTRMGKVATLQQGRWPNNYQRFGYTSFKEEGKRGRCIEIDEVQARAVRKIHEMYDAGVGTRDIRQYLISNNVEQEGHSERRYDWTPTVIYAILRAEDYTGIATWNFGDGTAMSIEIPTIISRDLWKRNQARLDRNRRLSTRNAKGVYLLQGLIYCGDCGRAMAIRRKKYYYEDGERHKYKSISHTYFCCFPNRYPELPHPRPFNRSGNMLDWLVWRYVVDNAITRPDVIRQQVEARQAELQAQSDSVDGEIAHARRKVSEVDQERAFYQRQAARGKITEVEFDQRMKETEEARVYWQEELTRLQELRDNTEKIQSGLDYTTELMLTLQEVLPEIDQTLEELKEMSEDKRDWVLKKRREILRALCNKVDVYADGRVVIEGLLDGSEAAQFDLGTRWRARRCPTCPCRW
jgi:DNA invertase Pin-like site-specific DNA recombinase